MRTSEFAEELLKMDPRISVVPNPNRPQLANIKVDGMDVCPIPAFEIRDDFDPTYTMEMPNGSVRPHKSKREALEMVNHILETIKTPEGADAFFARNGY